MEEGKTVYNTNPGWVGRGQGGGGWLGGGAGECSSQTQGGWGVTEREDYYMHSVGRRVFKDGGGGEGGSLRFGVLLL